MAFSCPPRAYVPILLLLISILIALTQARAHGSSDPNHLSRFRKRQFRRPENLGQDLLRTSGGSTTKSNTTATEPTLGGQCLFQVHTTRAGEDFTFEPQLYDTTNTSISTLPATATWNSNGNTAPAFGITGLPYKMQLSPAPGVMWQTGMAIGIRIGNQTLRAERPFPCSLGQGSTEAYILSLDRTTNIGCYQSADALDYWFWGMWKC